MIINNNLPALNSYRNSNAINEKMARSMEKLSSGQRINRAADDAAGLAISEKMRGQIRGLEKATQNAQHGISLIQTAEGSLNESHAILQRIRELAIQSANDTNTRSDREKMQLEVNELTKELDRIAGTTEFNTRKLLDGMFKDIPLIFQVGANKDQTVDLTFNKMDSQTLGIIRTSMKTEKDYWGNVTGKKMVVHKGVGISILSSDESSDAIDIVDNALEMVSTERAKFGAMQNRLEHTIANLRVASENLQAAESRIRDTDMAKEIVELNKNNIISKAANSMIVQANSKPESVLNLLNKKD